MSRYLDTSEDGLVVNPGGGMATDDHRLTARAEPIGAIEAFLLDRQLRGCTSRTLETYGQNLLRFARNVGSDPAEWAPLALRQYLTDLRQQLGAGTVHQHYRTLRTFLAWTAAAGYVPEDPMRGLTMRCPKTLPRVPEDYEVRRLLAACPDTWEGLRNRALVALLADGGLRVSEALRLVLADLSFSTQTLRIRQGKGQRDGTGFFGVTAAAYLRAWLAKRPGAATGEYVFVTHEGRPLTRFRATQILHRLSARARLPKKIGPHALRHFAATALLRSTGNLELVRQFPRHESLTMTLRYARLASPEVAARFRRASPLDNLGGKRSGLRVSAGYEGQAVP